MFPLITAEKLVGYAGAPALDAGAVLNNRERMNAAIKAKRAKIIRIRPNQPSLKRMTGFCVTATRWTKGFDPITGVLVTRSSTWLTWANTAP